MNTQTLIEKYTNMVADLKQEKWSTPEAHNGAQIMIATYLEVIQDLEKLKGATPHE